MKILSLAITMLFFAVAFGQEKDSTLYVLDGSFITYETFKKLKPENIKSITILKKDSSLSAISCRTNKRDVFIIKTKKISKRELRKMKKNKDS